MSRVQWDAFMFNHGRRKRLHLFTLQCVPSRSVTILIFNRDVSEFADGQVNWADPMVEDRDCVTQHTESVVIMVNDSTIVNQKASTNENVVAMVLQDNGRGSDQELAKAKRQR